jgi:hypothetical protein
MIRTTASALVLVALAAGSAAAQTAPAQMPMQGFLADTAGAPIDQELTMVFSFYTTDTGGAALYTETQTVMVQDGYFNADIGTVMPLDLALFRDNGTVFVGIQVGADPEMTPRIQLGTVPYAAFAQYAATGPTPTLECMTVSMMATATPMGGSFDTTVTCPDGYLLTGGGANMSGVAENFWWWQNGVDGDTAHARGYNQSTGTATITTFARCCRL